MAFAPFQENRLFSLRTKFVLFFSLILVIACSTLSWYYVQERRKTLTNNLHQLGTILLTSVVQNEHFHYAGLVAEDRVTLQQFVAGLVAVEDVVYVVITRSDGTVLAQYTKGSRQSSSSLVRSVDHPLYPDSQIAKQLVHSPNTTPLVTPFSLSIRIGSRFTWEEIVYDFAVPVLRTIDDRTSPLPFSIQLDEESLSLSATRPALVSGVVQIGLSDARRKQNLTNAVQDILLFAIFIISVGAFGAHLLTLRITKPLRNLSGVARQVAEGHSPVPLIPSTHDEVGQLTNAFNLMTRSLQERNLAITTNMSLSNAKSVN